MNIQLLLTGDELMNGDIVDSNSAMIAQQLDVLGARINRKVTVGDNLEALIKELNYLSENADILLVNGGLGPTRDDMTAEALSQLTGMPLQEHPAALQHLTTWCESRGYRINDANRKQVMLPQNARIIPNPRGSAVGIRVQHKNCEILCTPGVPSELKMMLEQTIIPELSQQLDPQQGKLLTRFHTFGLGESNLQQWVTDVFPDWPATVELGFRAGAPTLEVKLTAPASEAKLHQHWVKQLSTLIGDYIVAKDKQTLNQALVEALQLRGKKITTAESCTGGLIASMITEVPGSSAVFEAGYVTYANHIKSETLGVSADDLQLHGAVSETVVRQMAKGALKRSAADYVIAVSGIAGPDGGSPEKPVGLVWIAWGDQQQLNSLPLYFPYGRRLFQIMVAGTGLDLIRRLLLNIAGEPLYLNHRRPPLPAP